MTRSRTILRAAVGVLALVALVTAGSAPVAVGGGIEHRASGGGTTTFPLNDTLSDTFEWGFVAQQWRDGSVRGNASISETLSNGRGYTASVDVLCLDVVGNVAYISGVITDVEGEGFTYILGWTGLWAVEDNGVGPGVDRVSYFFWSVDWDPSTICQSPPLGLVLETDWNHGNFTVR